MTLADLLLRLWLHAHHRVAEAGRERGDVPGWVMVTVMTATLVTAILIATKSTITSAVVNAIDKVVNTN